MFDDRKSKHPVEQDGRGRWEFGHTLDLRPVSWRMKKHTNLIFHIFLIVICIVGVLILVKLLIKKVPISSKIYISAVSPALF